MKHLKLYEDFDWDEEDFDFEENMDMDIDIKKLTNTKYSQNKIVKVSDDKLEEFHKLIVDNGYRWRNGWIREFHDTSIDRYKKKPGKKDYYVVLQKEKLWDNSRYGGTYEDIYIIRNATLWEIDRGNIIDI